MITLPNDDIPQVRVTAGYFCSSTRVGLFTLRAQRNS